MMKYYLELKDRLEDFVDSKYQFRNNLLMQKLGQPKLEYQRIGETDWMPAGKFGRNEKEFFRQSAELKEYGQKINTYIPYRVLNQMVIEKASDVEDYLPHPQLHKIIEETAVAVEEVIDIDPLFRERVVLKEGEKCYVSIGTKLKGQEAILADPAIVKEVELNDERRKYTLLVLRFNSTLSRARELLTLHVSDIEVGTIPKQAVNNMVINLRESKR